MIYTLDLPSVSATMWGRTREDLLVAVALKELRRYRLNRTIERFNTEYFKDRSNLLLTKPSISNRLNPVALFNLKGTLSHG